MSPLEVLSALAVGLGAQAVGLATVRAQRRR